MTIREWLSQAAQRISDTPESKISATNPTLEAELILCKATGMNRAQVLASKEAVLQADQKALLDALAVRRTSGEPLAYILGEREFMGRPFKVDPRVLIPRTETEIVCEQAIAVARTMGAGNALDIGTGSGCIAVTLSIEVAGLEVHATDTSADALTVAHENAKALGAKVTFHRADLLPDSPSAFDLIVSNPPYIAQEEPLAEEVRSHEPKAALFSPEAGTFHYRAILEASRSRLSSDGRVVLEIGDGRLQALKEIAEQTGYTVEPVADDYDGSPRAMILRP